MQGPVNALQRPHRGVVLHALQLLAESGQTPFGVTTSTRDDRVHPGHSRKMVARLLELGKDVTYYENIEGGHGGAADNKQAAFLYTLQYTWLWAQLTAEPPSAAAAADQDSSSSQWVSSASA